MIFVASALTIEGPISMSRHTADHVRRSAVLQFFATGSTLLFTRPNCQDFAEQQSVWSSADAVPAPQTPRYRCEPYSVTEEMARGCEQGISALSKINYNHKRPRRDNPGPCCYSEPLSASQTTTAVWSRTDITALKNKARVARYSGHHARFLAILQERYEYSLRILRLSDYVHTVNLRTYSQLFWAGIVLKCSD